MLLLCGGPEGIAGWSRQRPQHSLQEKACLLRPLPTSHRGVASPQHPIPLLPPLHLARREQNPAFLSDSSLCIPSTRSFCLGHPPVVCFAAHIYSPRCFPSVHQRTDPSVVWSMGGRLILLTLSDSKRWRVFWRSCCAAGSGRVGQWVDYSILSSPGPATAAAQVLEAVALITHTPLSIQPPSDQMFFRLLFRTTRQDIPLLFPTPPSRF